MDGPGFEERPHVDYWSGPRYELKNTKQWLSAGSFQYRDRKHEMGSFEMRFLLVRLPLMFLHMTVASSSSSKAQSLASPMSTWHLVNGTQELSPCQIQASRLL